LNLPQFVVPLGVAVALEDARASIEQLAFVVCLLDFSWLVVFAAGWPFISIQFTSLATAAAVTLISV